MDIFLCAERTHRNVISELQNKVIKFERKDSKKKKHRVRSWHLIQQFTKRRCLIPKVTVGGIKVLTRWHGTSRFAYQSHMPQESGINETDVQSTDTTLMRRAFFRRRIITVISAIFASLLRFARENVELYRVLKLMYRLKVKSRDGRRVVDVQGW